MNTTGTHDAPVDDVGEIIAPVVRPAWRTWLVRVLTLVFFVAVALLLARQLRTLDWATVGDTLRNYRFGTLAAAAVLVTCSYLTYTGYELAARSYSGHTLPAPLVVVVGAITYAFNLNLGAWLGGIAFRYRLYSQLGVPPATTARIYLSTIATNWTGYLAVAGLVFALYGLDLPPRWELSDAGLRWIGVAMLLAAAGWLVACVRARDHRLVLRGHELVLPEFRLAAAQMALGAVNWVIMGGVIALLLPPPPAGPGYGTALATLLLACIAGVAAHIPAGLGVIEAVFLALLGHRVPHAQVLGALLAYRALYYLAPLLVAALGYAALESRIRRRR